MSVMIPLHRLQDRNMRIIMIILVSPPATCVNITAIVCYLYVAYRDFFYSDDCQFLLVFYRPENNEERIFAQVSKYRSYMFLNIHPYYLILIQKGYGD